MQCGKKKERKKEKVIDEPSVAKILIIVNPSKIYMEVLYIVF